MTNVAGTGKKPKVTGHHIGKKFWKNAPVIDSEDSPVSKMGLGMTTYPLCCLLLSCLFPLSPPPPQQIFAEHLPYVESWSELGKGERERL